MISHFPDEETECLRGSLPPQVYAAKRGELECNLGLSKLTACSLHLMSPGLWSRQKAQVANTCVLDCSKKNNKGK